MKKVIYINYMKQFGHINFDQIHINALINQGYDVKVVMHSDIAKKMNLRKDMYALIIPTILGHECKSGIINRLIYIIVLTYIKLHIDFSKFDYCIISNLDEISLSLIPLAKRMFLFCHGNSKGIENKIKRFFLKHLSKKHTFLVFSKEMAEPFKNNNMECVHIVSHGCMPAYKETSLSKKYNDIIQKYNFIVFHPSPKSDINFVKAIYTKENNEILKRNNILLILRNNPFEDKDFSNIIFINSYLESKDYQGIFKKANIILMAYPNSFKFQVSGVSYECIANRKNILILQNSSFSYCKDYYNYNIFFNSAEEAIRKIIKIKNNKIDYNCIVSAKDLIPNYFGILP